METAKNNGHASGKVIVVMPAYKAAQTIERAYREIPPGAADEVIIVDDASPDGTAARARKLGIETIVQPKNKGYGATQKRCYAEALARGADIIVMLHADAQYDARVIPELTAILRRGDADMVLGSRMKVPGDARRGGMPPTKIFVNRALTILQNFIFGTRLTDMHTGYRAYTRRCLVMLPIETNADGFLFDSQVLAQAAAFGLRIREVAVESRYFKEASSIGFYNGAAYTFGTLVIVMQFLLMKLGVAKLRMFRRPAD
ncbi:MAG: glycosyltransferase family 2 protein [Kiritimatiellaeota bacterium]|nr:glycosyltransferase family 2 protein [Kiritimatiellota bacterium]